MIDSPPIIDLTVANDPAATPRARYDPRRRRMYTPDVADHWKHAIAVELTRAGFRRKPEPPTCGFEVRLVLYFERPGYLDKVQPAQALAKITKPDLDNLEKAVLDVCTDEGVWRDDGQVFAVSKSKYFCAAGARPGARILITPHPELDYAARRKKPASASTLYTR